MRSILALLLPAAVGGAGLFFDTPPPDWQTEEAQAACEQVTIVSYRNGLCPLDEQCEVILLTCQCD